MLSIFAHRFPFQKIFSSKLYFFPFFNIFIKVINDIYYLKLACLNEKPHARFILLMPLLACMLMLLLLRYDITAISCVMKILFILLIERVKT